MAAQAVDYATEVRGMLFFYSAQASLALFCDGSRLPFGEARRRDMGRLGCANVLISKPGTVYFNCPRGLC
jgi:hypothetical protein